MTSTPRPLTLTELNTLPADEAATRCAGLFEHSPWIPEAALAERPFESIAAFHAACMRIVRASDEAARVGLISAHPDLVGRLAREGRLGSESTAEQAAAGLDRLSDAEVEAFERFNAAYHERFGFPFVICARKHRKDAILAAFPTRLEHEREEEIATAIEQIGEIGWLRMVDLIAEGGDDAD